MGAQEIKDIRTENYNWGATFYPSEVDFGCHASCVRDILVYCKYKSHQVAGFDEPEEKEWQDAAHQVFSRILNGYLAMPYLILGTGVVASSVEKGEFAGKAGGFHTHAFFKYLERERYDLAPCPIFRNPGYGYVQGWVATKKSKLRGPKWRNYIIQIETKLTKIKADNNIKT